MTDIGGEDGASRHVLVTAKGSGALASGYLFEIITRFGISFILARELGARGYGLYNLAISAGTIFAGIAVLGMDTAMVRFVAIQARRGDHAGLRGTLQFGLGCTIAASTLLGMVLYYGAEPISTAIFHEPALVDLLRLFSVIVPAMSLSNMFAGIAKGFKRMDHVALAENVVQSLVRLMLLIGLLATGLDVYEAAVVFGLSDVAATVCFVILTNRHLPLRSLFERGQRRDVDAILRFSLPLWLSGMLLQFRRNLQQLLLGALSVVSDVGLFSIVGRLNVVSEVIYSSVVTAVKPVLAELSTHEDRGALRRVYRASSRWTFMCNLPFFIVTTLYPTQLLAIFGRSFVAASDALVLLAVGELINAATGTCGSIIDMTGHTRIKVANSVAWVVLLAGLNLALVPRYGVLGAAAASMLSTSLVNIARVAQVRIVEGIQPFDRSFLKPLAAGISAWTTGYAALAFGVEPSGVLGIALAGVILTGVYAGASYVVGIAPEDWAIAVRVIDRGRRFVGR